MAVFRPMWAGVLVCRHVQWDDYNYSAYCRVEVGEDCDYGPHSGATADPEIFYGGQTNYAGKSAVALTYALTAGFDYRINKSWMFDMRY